MSIRRMSNSTRKTTRGFIFAALAGALAVCIASEGVRLIVPALGIERASPVPLPSRVGPLQAPTPGVQGDCNVNGPNYAPFNPNCHNTYLGPPREVGRLYQAGQMIGGIGSAHTTEGNKVVITNLKIGGLIDPHANIEIQGLDGSYVINCPALAENHPGPGLMQGGISIIGDTTCTIIGKSQ